MKYLDFIVGLFVAVLLISNVASSAKFVDLHWFSLGPVNLSVFDGGTLLFPIAYIFGDVLTEVYGYARARRVIWIGFVASLLMALTFLLIGALPGEAQWLKRGGETAFSSILGFVPRIVLGSLAAYWLGSFVNAFVMARLKVRTGGKHLWTRTVGSTVAGQAVDTVVFCLIAFAGILPSDVLISIIASNYVFKVGIEILMTPVTYLVVNKLKKAEGIDTFDQNTNFNPFKVRLEG